MKTSCRVALSGLAFCVALASSGAGQDAAGTVTDFSEARLREGKTAYSAKRPVEAVNQFHIAAFGFLDRPALLCESLVYLALASEAAERPAEAKAALERLTEVERRLPACGEARLDPSVRAEFESRFHRRLLAFPVPTARPKAPEPTPRPGG